MNRLDTLDCYATACQTIWQAFTNNPESQAGFALSPRRTASVTSRVPARRTKSKRRTGISKASPRTRSCNSDASELIQDTIAHTAALLPRAEAAGKKAAASTVASFAVKLRRSGRRSTHTSTTDVMQPGTQLAGRSRAVSVVEPLGFDEAGDSTALADVFDNQQDDPSTRAARNLD